MDSIDGVVPFRGLVEALRENVELQVSKPGKVVETTGGYTLCLRYMEHCDSDCRMLFSHLSVPKIMNCLFGRYGEAVFEGTGKDGWAHLMMQFCVKEGTGQYEKFRALEVYPDFEDKEYYEFRILSIDCKDDVERAAKIYTQVLTTIYDMPIEAGDGGFETKVGVSKTWRRCTTFLGAERDTVSKGSLWRKIDPRRSFNLVSMVMFLVVCMLFAVMVFQITKYYRASKLPQSTVQVERPPIDRRRAKWGSLESSSNRLYKESPRPFTLKTSYKEDKRDANQGNAEAQFCMGVRYEVGLDVDANDQTAVRWYQKAAEQGHARAQDNLGNCYRNGIGVARDDHKAVLWFRKAAEQGLPSAQNSLANCYALGEGVEKNGEEAVRWWKIAIEQDCESAKYNLELYRDKPQ